MSFTLACESGFSLQASAQFANEFPGTSTIDDGDLEPDAAELSFAWPLDGDWRSVQVLLRQVGDVVTGTIEAVAGSAPTTAAADPELTAVVRRDVERILSLDVDAGGFAEVGRADPVVGGLQQQFPGLRPVLFYTPYEAAAWAIIGHRISMKQAANIKTRLAQDYGELGGFPAPAMLAELPADQRGLSDRKVEQLRGLGQAALDGALDRDHLRGQSYQDSETELKKLAGVGPFSAELILIRGMGAPDALAGTEKRFQAATRAAYGLAEDADITAVAERWRPYRSWVTLLLRASS